MYCLQAVFWWIALFRPAQAGPIDTHGFGAAAMGRGLGGVALSDGAADVFRNPAGVQSLDGAHAFAGFSWMRHQLVQPGPVRWDTNRDGRIDDTDEPLSVGVDYGRSDSIQLGLGRSIGRRLGVAFNASFPIDRILDISTFDPALPTWFRYENRLRRYEAAAGFGWEQFPGVRVGGGVQLLTRARYDVSATLTAIARAAEEGDEQAVELISDVTLDIHEMSLDLEPTLAPTIALMWDVGALLPPLDGVQFGATWRGSTGLPVDVEVDLQIDGTVESVGDLEETTLTLLAPFDIALLDHYVPAQWAFGLAWARTDALRVYGDVLYTRWDALPINVAQVREGAVQSQLLGEETLTIEDGNPFMLELAAVWSGRVGAEIGLPTFTAQGNLGTIRPIIRGGWSVEPSPLRGTGDNVSLLDSDRTVFTAGLGVQHGSPFGLASGPVSWDIYAQLHPLADGQVNVSYTDAFTPGAPIEGSSVPVGGQLWSAGGQWSIRY